MKLWGLRLANGKLASVALRSRKEVQDWAGQRYMSSESYRNRQGNPSLIWYEVQRRHPAFRLVRVTVSEPDDPR